MDFIKIIENFLASPNVLVYIIRILIATACGAFIGLERTKRSKEAGIRTHCIIACAAALVMIVSKYCFIDLATAEGFFAGTRGADPSRIAAQAVSGIGFLGAGVIFKNGNTVKGLTTAAGIWATAAVGLACGGGMYFMAIFVTALIVAVQLLMHKFAVGNDAFSTGEIRITFRDTPEIRKILTQKQKELGIDITSSRVSMGADGTISFILGVRLKNAIPFEDVMKFVDEHPEIISLSV